MEKKNEKIYTIIYILLMFSIIGANQFFLNSQIVYVIEIVNIFFISGVLAVHDEKIDKDTYKVLKSFLALYIFIFIYSVIILLIGDEYRSENFTRALSTTIYGILAITNGIFSYKFLGKKSIIYIFYICVIIYSISIVQYINEVGIKGFINYYFNSEKLGNKLEIHGYGYIFGLYFIYFVLFNKNKTNALISLIYCILVWKRIVLLTIVITIIVYFILTSNKKDCYRKTLISGLILFMVFQVYIVLIKSGQLDKIAEKYNINFMSRLEFYDYFKNNYEYSIFYSGHYLGYTDKVMEKAATLKALDLQSATSLHNDILRYYIDLGFVVSTIWFIFFLYHLPKNMFKEYGNKAGVATFIIIMYYFVNQMVCNIARSNIFNLIYVCMILVVCNQYKKEENIKKIEGNDVINKYGN